MAALNKTPLMVKMTIALLFIIIGLSSFDTTSAFQMISSPINTQRSFSSSSLNMAAKGKGPRFDKAAEKWIVTDPEVGE